MTAMDDLKAKGLSEHEARAMLAISDWAEGAPDLKALITKPHHEAIDNLIARGLVRQVWALSPAGRELLGLQSDD